MGEDIKNIPDYRQGIICRWLFPGEVYRLLDMFNLINRNKKPLKGKYKKMKDLREFFKYFFLKNVGYDVLSITDPLPFIFNSLRWIRRFQNIR